jgi:hypothetical protein
MNLEELSRETLQTFSLTFSLVQLHARASEIIKAKGGIKRQAAGTIVEKGITFASLHFSISLNILLPQERKRSEVKRRENSWKSHFFLRSQTKEAKIQPDELEGEREILYLVYMISFCRVP